MRNIAITVLQTKHPIRTSHIVFSMAICNLLCGGEYLSSSFQSRYTIRVCSAADYQRTENTDDCLSDSLVAELREGTILTRSGSSGTFSTLLPYLPDLS